MKELLARLKAFGREEHLQQQRKQQSRKAAQAAASSVLRARYAKAVADLVEA